VHALGPVYNRGRRSHMHHKLCGMPLRAVLAVFAVCWSCARRVAATLRTYSAMPMSHHHSFTGGRLCRSTPRDVVKDKSAFTACNKASRRSDAPRSAAAALAVPTVCSGTGGGGTCGVAVRLLAGRLRGGRVGRLVSVRRRHRPARAHAPDCHAALVGRPRVPGAGRRSGLRGCMHAGSVGAVGRMLGVVRRW
jgi:hypothetical protein